MLQYHGFEDGVLENIKARVVDETASFSGEGHYWKHEGGRKEASDSEMLKTYSTGLLAVCLTGYVPCKDFLFPCVILSHYFALYMVYLNFCLSQW